MTPFAIIATPILAGIICALLIVMLYPLMKRYAMASPNARSSHSVPTPQGGGGPVVLATTASFILISAFTHTSLDLELVALLGAVIFIGVVGAIDDLHPIPVLPRLLLQAMTVSVVLVVLPANFHLFGWLPLPLERVLLLVAALWFINLVNFMDGLDWMTVAEVVPVAIALALFGWLGYLHGNATLISLSLAGAMIGFAPFNRPVAKLFLGDVGSLPIGLLVGWCLLQLAGSGHLTAAVLLPLYYLADATITLARRIANHEDVRIAHRSHFYQRATSNGLSVMRVVTDVFLLNVVLAFLGALTIVAKSTTFNATILIAGCLCVWFVLRRFSSNVAQSA